MGMSLDKAESTFPVAAWKLESPGRTIHMLVMVDHMRDAPKEQDRERDLDLYRSEFGTGYVACGNMCEAEGGKKFTEPPLMVLSCKSTLFHPPLQSSSRGRPWGQSCLGGALRARIARSANSRWTACRSKRIVNTK